MNLSRTGKLRGAIDNPKEAIQYAQEHAAPEDAIFIGGSNYLVGEACMMYDV